MLSKSTGAYFWLGWGIGTDAVSALTIYQKLVPAAGATVEPFGPPITCPICRKREATFDEVMKYGPTVAMDRSRIFEIPNAPVGSIAAHVASSGTPPRGPALTVINKAGAPGAGDGANGNWCMDTTNGVLYGPKASGAWPATPKQLIAFDQTVVKESDGTLWTVQRIQSVIYDNLQILVCLPWIGT